MHKTGFNITLLFIKCMDNFYSPPSGGCCGGGGEDSGVGGEEIFLKERQTIVHSIDFLVVTCLWE